MSRSKSATQGKSGQAFNFGYTNNDYVSIPHNAVHNVAGTFTVAAWVKEPNTNNHGAIFEKMNAGAPFNGLSLYVGQSGDCNSGGGIGKRIHLTLFEHYVTSYSCIYTNRDIIDGNWHHIVGVADATTAQLMIYVDGVEAPTSAGPTVGSFPNTNYSGTAYIGGRVGSSYFLGGPIDDVRFYNRALTAAEVRQLYNLGRSTTR